MRTQKGRSCLEFCGRLNGFSQRHGGTLKNTKKRRKGRAFFYSFHLDSWAAISVFRAVIFMIKRALLMAIAIARSQDSAMINSLTLVPSLGSLGDFDRPERIASVRGSAKNAQIDGMRSMPENTAPARSIFELSFKW